MVKSVREHTAARDLRTASSMLPDPWSCVGRMNAPSHGERDALGTTKERLIDATIAAALG